MTSQIRLQLVEYGPAVDLCAQLTSRAGLSTAEASRLLLDAGTRLAVTLRSERNPISVERRGVRAEGISGVLRLSPTIELEVAPKFLGLDDETWREDFLFLSILSQHGSLLPADIAVRGGDLDLAGLLGRIFAAMYARLRNKPLRTYQRQSETTFSVDGDFDPLALTMPAADGFFQERSELSRENMWNSQIVSAAQVLLKNVTEPGTASQLMRLVDDLSPQRRRRAPRGAQLPSRHRRWEPLYQLANDVMNRLGVSYSNGTALGPGYIVQTWRLWEDLLVIASRLAFGANMISSQHGFVLGSRLKLFTNKTTALSVYPDCVIKLVGGAPEFLLDAKYKGYFEKGAGRISEADVYEALAFAQGAQCDTVVLAYPYPSNNPSLASGECVLFERVKIRSIVIIGVYIEVRSISRRGGLQTFACNLAAGMKVILAEETASKRFLARQAGSKLFSDGASRAGSRGS